MTQEHRKRWATALGWLALPIWLAGCWIFYTLVRSLFGVDLTTEMVLHAIKIALISPFIAIGATGEAAVSAFLGLPLIGQIIIVVAVALWIVAMIVDNAVQRIRGRQ